MHSKFTPKICSASKVHSKSFGVHLKSTPKFGVHSKLTPKTNWSTQHSTPKISKFWSAQLPTPILLEWTAVHSIFVFWSGHLPTPKCWSKCSKVLECIYSDPVTNCPTKSVNLNQMSHTTRVLFQAIPSQTGGRASHKACR
jgi:hypothetical protein